MKIEFSSSYTLWRFAEVLTSERIWTATEIKVEEVDLLANCYRLSAREVLDIPNDMKTASPESMARTAKLHYNSYVKSLRELRG
jgi:hypothetical protein